ncbi:MAG: hypothetical protein Q4G71_07805 [Pseudomonadota bacterium]|nr:hypothetical protein [Pseudomonadota bacterium]
MALRAAGRAARVTGGTIPALGSCTLTFNVTPVDPNAYLSANLDNTIAVGGVTADNGGRNTAAFSGRVNLRTGAQIVKSFDANPVNHNGTSTFRLEIRNFNSTTLTPITFTDNLPAGVVATGISSGASNNTCGGTATVASDSGSVTYTGGSLDGAPSTENYSSCFIRFTYRGENVGSTPSPAPTASATWARPTLAAWCPAWRVTASSSTPAAPALAAA